MACFSSEILPRYETFLESLKLCPDYYKIKDVEMDLCGNLNPSIHLDYLFFKQQHWLGFDDFFDWYLEKHGEQMKQEIPSFAKKEFDPGLRARLYRTQFGFLTEYHAFFLSQKVFGDENVSRDQKMDIAGVDFKITLEGIPYNIHIFVDTVRAWKYRNYKSQFKSVDTLPGIHVNLPYALSAGRFNSLRFLKNKFGVFTESYLTHVKREIVSGNIQNNNIIGTNPDGFQYR